MTIQRTALCALAMLTFAFIQSNASAQCSRTRPVYINPYGHHHHHHPLTTAYAGQYSAHHSGYTQTALLPSIPTKCTFGACSHVDDLALRLEILMNELCLDLYYNYAHNPGFPETYSEAFSLYQIAKSIHAAEHHFNREAVRQQLTGADGLFHHIQDDVKGWSRHSQVQIGTLGIITKMAMAEETLHHLMEDVGVSLSTGLPEPPVPTALNGATATTALSVPQIPSAGAVAPAPPVLP